MSNKASGAEMPKVLTNYRVLYGILARDLQQEEHFDFLLLADSDFASTVCQAADETKAGRHTTACQKVGEAMQIYSNTFA